MLIVELLNTAIEIVLDRISPDFHELSGRAKDIGSAAVALAMFVFLLVWGVILVENLGLI
ncbi:MAG: Diacylglycerol kinase [Cellvibrionales bacterium UBA7375]|nr:MAG: Diacylglycerol kinase [Cellvibrionales bacterium UBA7375]